MDDLPCLKEGLGKDFKRKNEKEERSRHKF